MSFPKSLFAACEGALTRAVEREGVETVRRGAAGIDGKLGGAVVNEDASRVGATDCAGGSVNAGDGSDAWIGAEGPLTAVKGVGEIGVPSEERTDGETGEV